MYLLFRLEDVFGIPGRGCVLVPGVPYGFPHDVRVGSAIVIERPDGSHLETVISGLEMINRGKPMGATPISVPKNISKKELPPGAQVFLRG